MKKMHELVVQCVNSLDAKLQSVAQSGEEVDVKKTMGDYTMDVIARCAFATRIDTHNQPNNVFVLNAVKVFSVQIWRTILFLTFKPLMKLLNISIIDSEAISFFKNAVSFLLDFELLYHYVGNFNLNQGTSSTEPDILKNS